MHRIRFSFKLATVIALKSNENTPDNSFLFFSIFSAPRSVKCSIDRRCGDEREREREKRGTFDRKLLCRWSRTIAPVITSLQLSNYPIRLSSSRSTIFMLDVFRKVNTRAEQILIVLLSLYLFSFFNEIDFPEKLYN